MTLPRINVHICADQFVGFGSSCFWKFTSALECVFPSDFKARKPPQTKIFELSEKWEETAAKTLSHNLCSLEQLDVKGKTRLTSLEIRRSPRPKQPLFSRALLGIYVDAFPVRASPRGRRISDGSVKVVKLEMTL